jgi:2-haloacid dehalogenase
VVAEGRSPARLDLDSFEILSFDCYGTLVDWESGILSALAPVLSRHRCSAAPHELLEAYGRLESRAQEPPYRPYAIVLREVMEGLGRLLGFAPAASELDTLASSIPAWPLFPDTRQALRALRTKYRLAVLSNIDDDLFAMTAPALGVEPEWVVTAAQVGSYKPSLENFRRALARFGRPKQKVLHVAQSLFHDIAPARALGLSSVWVNRRHGLPGAGATPPADARPDLEVHDLKSLASLAGVW